jgi:aryl-alcohol dehydrogenase-like predicted oxidoreductase
MSVANRILACGLEVSEIGLGSDRLHHVISKRDREALISAAIDAGVTHFDTAPFYGDGLTERLLGELLDPQRNQVTIATKFGLLPNRFIGDLGAAGVPLRAMRSVLRRMRLLTFPHRCFDISRMRESIRTSLRALRTDHVDIFFLHEPRLVDMTEALIEAIHELKRQGLARYVGIAGSEVAPIVERFGSHLDVVQTAENEWSGKGFTPDITYGAAQAAGSSDKSRAAQLREALARRPHGTILVGTTKARRVQELAVS